MRRNDGRAIPTFITQALRGEPVTVHGAGEQTRSICYVDDLVRGILLLLDSTETGPVNCGTEHETSMRDLAETIVRLAGSRSELVFLPRTPDDPEMRRPDLTLARDLLGYEPTIGPEEGCPDDRLLSERLAPSHHAPAPGPARSPRSSHVPGKAREVASTLATRQLMGRDDAGSGVVVRI